MASFLCFLWVGDLYSSQEAKVRRAAAHVKRARAVTVDNELLVELPACLNTKPCLYRVIDGLERLIFYREEFRAFVRQLRHGFHQGELLEKDTTTLPLISEFIEKIELLSRFLQVSVLHAVIYDCMLAMTLYRYDLFGILNAGDCEPFGARALALAVRKSFPYLR